MNNKKIALIDPVGGKAGMDFYDLSILESISAYGYKAYLFSNFDKKSASVQVVRSFNNIGKNKIISIFNNFYNFAKALFFCRRNNISWLILHFFRGGIFDLVTIGLARYLGLKIILIIHDVKSLDTVVFPITRRIILTHFNFAKVVHNQYSFNKLNEVIHKRYMGNVHIIPHGNYISLFESEPSMINAKAEFSPLPGIRYLLFFGQLKKAKGLDILIKAMSIAQSSFHLLIAGQSRDDDFSLYRDLVFQGGLEKRVTFITRHITNEERDFYFRTCEIVVIPYKRVYQSGVLLMAMSYAKTVVVSAIEPNKEVIIEGENGFLFETENPSSLAELLEKLDHGQYDQNNIGLQALKTAKDGHNWLKIGLLYAKILET